MSDYEMLMIVLMILTLLFMVDRKNDRSCEPPISLASDRRFLFRF